MKITKTVYTNGLNITLKELNTIGVKPGQKINITKWQAPITNNQRKMLFAYDTPDDYDPLIEAAKKLFQAGFTKESHVLRCYNLIGFPGDTFEKALIRIKQTWDAGFMPMAMLWRDDTGRYDLEWRRFQRQWANPVITAVNCKNMLK